MMNKEASNLSRTFKIAALAATVATLAATVAFADPGYDVEQSRAKLERIGQALQRYRSQLQVKPVAQRSSPAEAGLPEHLHELATPNKPYSLEGGMADFRVRQPNRIVAGSDSHFTALFWSQETASKVGGLFDMTPYLARRGEDLPILADFNVTSLEDGFQRRQATAVILRLSGRVDVVTYDPFKRLDIYEK